MVDREEEAAASAELVFPLVVPQQEQVSALAADRPPFDLARSADAISVVAAHPPGPQE